MTDSGPRSEPTGMVPRVETRLADFLGGQPELPHAVLLVVAGQARGSILVVDSVPSVIGRSSGADITIADETVSRRHAEFRGERNELELEDLGSSNGTTLNGNDMVGAVTLHDGDFVGLGSATLLVKTIS